MKAIILAAGYATRLYPLTLNKPKALLEINDTPILDYILDEIETIDDIDDVFIVTNHKFYDHFFKWKMKRKTIKNIEVIDDGSTCEEQRLGAIGDMNLVIESKKIFDDIMVIAGDNYFTFKLLDFYRFYLSIKKDCLCVKELNNDNDLIGMGVVKLDNTGRVTHFEEKPLVPKSNIAVYAIYIYMKETLPLIEMYLKEGNKPDAPGFFPAWLYNRKDVYGYMFNGDCYDIGTHQAYNEIRQTVKNV